MELSNTFITIIGDQPAPNIFLIKDQYFAHIDHYIFLTTALMKARKKLAYLVAALALQEKDYEEVEVSPNDPSAIRFQLQQLNLASRVGRFFVHITSGSKIMSIGVFNYFTSAAFSERSEIFYLSIRDRHFLRIHPEERYEALPLSHQIKLQEYLNSNGVFHRYGASSGFPKYPFAQAQAIYQMHQESEIRESLSRFHKRSKYIINAQRADRQHLALTPSGEWMQLLSALSFEPTAPNRLQLQEVKYLRGEWFEEWVYYQLSKHLGLSPSAIACSLHIELDNELGRSEFDVLFLHNDQLYVIECKSGLPDKYIPAKRIFDPAALRLAALRSTFGLKVKTIFLTSALSLRKDNLSGYKPAIERKALSLQIQILDAVDLREPPERWIPKLFQTTS